MIKIITLHSIPNPGSVLQAYALQRFLFEKGYNNEIIDYRPYYSNVGKNKVKGIIREILFYRNQKSLQNKYSNFVRENLKLTNETYDTFKSLINSPPIADKYLTGSDQLWNLSYDCGKDDAYYLKFIENNKYSFATSIGKSNIPSDELNNILGNINSFKGISVREKSTSEILSSKLNRKVEWVCDPVFLLDKDSYKNMIKSVDFNDYVIIYLSKSSDLLNNIIAKIKKDYGYKIILAGGNITRCTCDLHIKDLGPYDFLSYLYNAKLVISSSFHATAFSHIFHKEFLSILPEGNSERIESLLKLTELENRIVKNVEDLSCLENKIDFSLVEQRLKGFISNSKEFLIKKICED